MVTEGSQQRVLQPHRTSAVPAERAPKAAVRESVLAGDGAQGPQGQESGWSTSRRACKRRNGQDEQKDRSRRGLGANPENADEQPFGRERYRPTPDSKSGLDGASAGAKKGWMVGPQGFEPWTDGLKVG